MKEEKDVCSLAWARCAGSCVISMTENHTRSVIVHKPVIVFGAAGLCPEREQLSASSACPGVPGGVEAA